MITWTLIFFIFGRPVVVDYEHVTESKCNYVARNTIAWLRSGPTFDVWRYRFQFPRVSRAVFACMPQYEGFENE